MCGYGGDDIFYQIERKLEYGEELLPEEIFKLSILPLMKTSENRQEMIEKCIDLAKKIPEDNKQLQVIAGILTATDKFIDENYAQQIREWIRITKVGRIIEKELEENTQNTINIFQLYQKGKNTEQIAHQLKLSDRVVKNVIAKIKNIPN